MNILLAVWALCLIDNERIFLSPYKDNRPFPDSLKDFSKPIPINLLYPGSVDKSNSKFNPSLWEIDKKNTEKGQQDLMLSPALKKLP